MTRSNLTTKFLVHNISEFEKQYKKDYKNENGEPFKGNVLDAITLGVIRNKGIPDISDTITIVALGNYKVPIEQVEAIIERELEKDDYRSRGLIGVFCDACKDLVIDIPLNQQFVNNIVSLEEIIQKRLESKEKINDLLNKLSSLGDKLKESLDNDNGASVGSDNKIVPLPSDTSDVIDNQSR